MPVSTSSDTQPPQAQSFAMPLSPAAMWLTAFSPRTIDDSVMPALSFEGSETPKDLHSDESPPSPAAQYLTRFSSPPPPLSQSSPAAPSGEIAGYRLGKLIGKGISQVRLATSVVTGAVVAVKISPRSTSQPSSAAQSARLKNEERIWSTLNHEHILPLLSVLQTTEMTAFVTLYCPDGSLLDLLEKRRHIGGDGGLEGDLVRSIFRHITRGIAYLHNTMHIVHGDIKLENILIDDNGNVRVADFGCAQYIGDPPGATDNPHNAMDPDTFSLHHPASAWNLSRDQDTIHASLPYAAPELLRPPSSLQQHHFRNPARDIWALGCALHALLTGSLPFADAYEPRLHLKISKGDWETQSTAMDSDRVILRGCLCVDPVNRWTISKVEAHAHEIGAGAYTKPQRKAEKPRSRVRHSHLYRSASSSRERLRERHPSRDRCHSTVREAATERIDVPTCANDVYPITYRACTPGVSDEDSVEPKSSRAEWMLSPELRDVGGLDEVLIPPDDTLLTSLNTRNRTGRSTSRGRSSRQPVSNSYFQ